MKHYKAIGFAGVTAALLLTLAVCFLPEQGRGRFRQHREAAPKAPCEREHTDGELCTHLPLLLLDTGGLEIPGMLNGERDGFGESLYTTAPDGGSTILARLAVIDDPERHNHPSDEPVLELSTELRVRGHSSRHFEKAPYLLKFRDEQGENRDEPLLGMDAHHEWVLHGPYLDKSLIRNYMFYNLSGELMEYAPNCRFCELILNGDYRGIYLAVETITAGRNCRLPLLMKARDAQLTGYLLRVDRPTEAEDRGPRDTDMFVERSAIEQWDVSVRYPGQSRMTETLKRQIERDFSAFEKALYSFDFDSPRYGYRRFIDVDNFVDYYIINSLTSNQDAGSYSTYLYRKLGDRCRLCVWDFNNCCDNYVDNETGPDLDPVRESVYFNMLFRSPDFVERVIRRYQSLRRGVLSTEALDAYIDETLAFLGSAVERDSARWADYIAGDPLLDPAGSGRNPHSQAEAVDMLRQNLRSRARWLDGNIDYLRQYCAPSATKTYQADPT